MYSIDIESDDQLFNKTIQNHLEDRNYTVKINETEFVPPDVTTRVKAAIRFMNEQIYIPDDMPIPIAITAIDSFISTVVMQSLIDEGLIIDSEGEAWDNGINDRIGDYDIDEIFADADESVELMILTHPQNVFKAVQLKKEFIKTGIRTDLNEMSNDRLKNYYEFALLNDAGVIYTRAETNKTIRAILDQIIPIFKE